MPTTTFTEPVALGTGDAQQMYHASTAQNVAVKKGTSGSPDTALNPLVKVERTMQITQAALDVVTSGGDGGEQCAAIMGLAVGTASNEVQPVGVYGAAKIASTVGGPGNDACGLYGVGRVTGSGNGVALGAYIIGRRDTNTAYVSALEIAAHNETATDATYNSAGYGTVHGIWIQGAGTARAGTGIMFGKFGTRPAFDVGIGFSSQNPVVTTTFRDDGNAATSLLVKGTHATAGIAIGAGSGPLIVGRETLLQTSALLEVSNNGSKTPLVNFNGDGVSDGLTVRLANGTGSCSWFISGGVDQFLTGTVAADTGIKVNTTAKKFHLGGTTPVVAVSQANGLGFFNVTPVTQQAGIVDADGTLADITTKFNSLLSKMEAYGLLAVA